MENQSKPMENHPNTWVKQKMAVALSAANTAKIIEFTNGLPPETEINNLSKLLVYLVENQNKPTVNHTEEVANHLQTIHELQAENDKLKSKLENLSKPQENDGKPTVNHVQTDSKPMVNHVQTDSKPMVNQTANNLQTSQKNFKNYWQ